MGAQHAAGWSDTSWAPRRLDQLEHWTMRWMTFAARTLRLVENFLRPLGIVEFVSDDAAAYAGVRAKVERAATPIGPLDILIAAQAVARKLILVSNDEREFGRVAGLRIESWAA